MSKAMVKLVVALAVKGLHTDSFSPGVSDVLCKVGLTDVRDRALTRFIEDALVELGAELGKGYHDL